MTRASIVVPTHDHASTLDLTVRSALQQSEPDLEVLIVGDGATAQVRQVARDLSAADDRVVFLDLEKGPHHGEIHRHTAIEASRGDHVFYLCDDDLLMPDHVTDLCALLADADFVQCRNGHVRADGSFHPYPGDLSRPASVARLRDASRLYNFVSLTGTAHTREYYDRAATPWQTTPPDIWPDLHQWRRMLAAAPARTATSTRMTALQFPSHLDGREHWTPDRRLAELEQWFARLTDPAAQAEVDAAYAAATALELAAMNDRAGAEHAARLVAEQALAGTRQELTTMRQELTEVRREWDSSRSELAAMRSSRSWHLTSGLRSLRRRWEGLRR